MDSKQVDQVPRKGYLIIVNGRENDVPGDEVTYDQVVDIAFPDGGRGDLIEYTVAYTNGGGRKTEGTVLEGDKVKVKDRTEFLVERTDRS